MKRLLPLLILASTLSAEPPSVTAQIPAYTMYAGTTAPGVEVDLGRMWIQGESQSLSMSQLRVSFCDHLDFRASNGMFAIQASANASDSLTVGVLKQWGHDYDKWYFMASQKVSDTLTLDVNFDTSKSLQDGSHTETYAGNFYYTKDRWSFGLDVAHNVAQMRNTTGMLWGLYMPKRKLNFWIGVSQELQLSDKATTLAVGTSFRF